MEPEDELKMLRRMRQDVIVAARDMKAALLELYAPRQTPRSPEMLAAVQLLASGEGFDADCRNHACRRAGLCQADDVKRDCAPLWPRALRRRLNDMSVGIALADICDDARRAAIHAYIAKMFVPEAAAPGRKRGRGRSAGAPR